MAEENPEWMVSGDCVEGCTSPPVCPLYWQSPAPKDLHDGKSQCEGVFSFSIGEGYRGDVDLAGLKVCYGFNSPTGVPEVGRPWKCILFIDERADDRQAEALGQIYTRSWGLMGDVLKVKRAVISFARESIGGGPAARHTVEIKGVYGLKSEPLLTMDGKPRYINSVSGGVINIGRSVVNEFRDADLPRTWNQPGMSTTYYDFVLTPKKPMWMP